MLKVSVLGSGNLGTHMVNLLNDSSEVELVQWYSRSKIDNQEIEVTNDITMLKNAEFVIKKTGCDAIKLENYKKNYEIIEALVKKKIPVMGHIGYTPQFNKKFKIAGQTQLEIKKLLKQAKLIEKAGAFSIVLECLSPDSAKLITNELSIPTIGIGSSSNCDGQILVTDDMLGLSGFYPKFVKKYISLEKILNKVIKKFRNDVIKNNFPKISNTY